MAALDAELKHRARQAAASLQRRGKVRAAFVFGSQVQGRADEWSDIDIAAFIDGVEAWDAWRRARFCTEVQKEVGFEVEMHLFPASSLADPPPGSFAQYVIQQGIPIRLDDTRTDH